MKSIEFTPDDGEKSDVSVALAHQQLNELISKFSNPTHQHLLRTFFLCAQAFAVSATLAYFATRGDVNSRRESSQKLSPQIQTLFPLHLWEKRFQEMGEPPAGEFVVMDIESKNELLRNINLTIHHLAQSKKTAKKNFAEQLMLQYRGDNLSFWPRLHWKLKMKIKSALIGQSASMLNQQIASIVEDNPFTEIDDTLKILKTLQHTLTQDINPFLMSELVTTLGAHLRGLALPKEIDQQIIVVANQAMGIETLFKRS